MHDVLLVTYLAFHNVHAQCFSNTLWLRFEARTRILGDLMNSLLNPDLIAQGSGRVICFGLSVLAPTLPVILLCGCCDSQHLFFISLQACTSKFTGCSQNEIYFSIFTSRFPA